jgi:hypothetical protein
VAQEAVLAEALVEAQEVVLAVVPEAALEEAQEAVVVEVAPEEVLEAE